MTKTKQKRIQHASMSAQDFQEFIRLMDWSALQTSEHLDLHHQTVHNYLRGHRSEDTNKLVIIPHVVYLACRALAVGIR